MSLSLGSVDFLVVPSTAGMVLGLISSLSGLVVGMPSGMLCERDQVLYASPSMSKNSWSGMFTIDLCELSVGSLPR